MFYSPTNFKGKGGQGASAMSAKRYIYLGEATVDKSLRKRILGNNEE